MRILIVTDSLGMPRGNVDIENTWTRSFIKEYGGCFEVFTFLKSGLTSNDVISEADQLLGLFKPDIVIFQIGIVDCVRRVLSPNVVKILSRIPIISKYTREMIRKKHYFLTKIHELKYVGTEQFVANIEKISYIAHKRGIVVAFIKIAGPGNALIESTYGVEEDIDLYNQIINMEVRKHSNTIFVDPYEGQNLRDYLLEEDGYHLNAKGNELVFNSLVSMLDEIRKHDASSNFEK
ncbi:Lysophospholipase L1 [Pelosinus fermentans]|uniref:SGNH/GDSL hydrolase family protein n=1 Tax=Pelosinus fermentans TaxID=365349 RepID=UPI0002685D9C|nr:SGNH/GDSL hydrolase family protein [Pelosinus fermentans]OAM92789.1 hypothetical protein FR7_00805 [Pelosinus fermentans DSM 17108]SDQ56908.1 Lysophospholipase L1 [Pelosinus fermentans]